MEAEQFKSGVGEPWDPAWDQEVAEAAIGKVVLAGLISPAADGTTVKRQVQYYGAVIAADANDGVTIGRRGERAGERIRLLPDAKVFAPAAPGEYRLRSTREVVVDPGFATQWTITEPRH
jgi:hypothetical protein